MVVLSGIDAFSRWTAASTNALLPVELATFEARRDDESVALTWETLSETNSAAFTIQRANATARDTTDLRWTSIGRVQAAGTINQSQTYRFNDGNVPYAAQTLHYRLKQIDRDGTATYEGEVEVSLDAPRRLSLHGNFPNPFRDATTIRYELPEAADVRLSVFDMLGRRVQELVNERQTAGRKQIRFDAANLPSGSYFYRLRVDDQTDTRRLIIVR